PPMPGPGRDGEARDHAAIGGQQGLERNRNEDAFVAVILFFSYTRVHRIGHRVPRTQFYPDAEAPLDLEASPVIAGEKPAHPRRQRRLIWQLVVNRRERSQGLVVPKIESPC